MGAKKLQALKTNSCPVSSKMGGSPTAQNLLQSSKAQNRDTTGKKQ
jgi:hypothetical protein